MIFFFFFCLCCCKVCKRNSYSLRLEEFISLVTHLQLNIVVIILKLFLFSLKEFLCVSIGSCRRKGERRRKAVICQQTKNLQDNYDYWLAVLRREEEQQEKVCQMLSHVFSENFLFNTIFEDVSFKSGLIQEINF